MSLNQDRKTKHRYLKIKSAKSSTRHHGKSRKIIYRMRLCLIWIPTEDDKRVLSEIQIVFLR